MSKKASLLLVFHTCACLLIGSCASKSIPRFDGRIFSLDQKNKVIRYKFDAEVISLDDPKVDGAVVFIGESFDEFVKLYIAGCQKFDDGLEMIEVSAALREKR